MGSEDFIFDKLVNQKHGQFLKLSANIADSYLMYKFQYRLEELEIYYYDVFHTAD